MPLRDTLAALLVVFVWGVTFVVIKIGVGIAPPFLLAGLRFTFAAIPAIFFIAPPRTRPRYVIAYGLFLGVIQFGLLFIAMRLGLPAGLTSILVQSQVFFTLAFAYVWLGQRPTPIQLGGVLVGVAGILVIGLDHLQPSTAQASLLVPILVVLVAAAGWGAANVVGMKAGRVDMLAFTVWSSLAAPLPLFALSVAFDGPGSFQILLHPTWLLIFIVLFLAGLAQLLGFGIWSRLLSLHPAAVVTPFALLVPVFGLVSAWLAFGEPMSLVEAIGGLLVLLGLAINVFGARMVGWVRQSPSS